MRPTLVVIAVALVVSAACSSFAGGRRSSVVITFMAFGEPAELKAYRSVIAAFRHEEPAVRVRLVEASDREDLLARLSTAFAGGAPPDLFLVNYRYFGQFAAKGVLEPIERRLDSSDAFRRGSFYREALEAFRFDGELTCLPQNVSSLVVYYNKELFRRTRVRLPKPGWRWHDMVAKAKALTRDTNFDGTLDVYGLGVEPSLIRLAPFIWSNGGELVKRDGSGLALRTPAALDALENFLRLRRVYRVIPSEEEREAEDDETRFLRGHTAMVLSSRRSTPSFRTITRFDWDVAPLPRHRRPAGILHSDAYCMTRASEHKDAAWRFTEFALGPQGQRLTAASGRTVPSLKEVARSAAFLDPAAKPASSEVFLETIPYIRRVPSISTWPEIEAVSEPILEDAMYEAEADAKDVAAELETATREIFARAEG